jgi:hypothetical protein
VAYPGIFFRWMGGGGCQQIQLKTEGRENGDLRALTPSQGLHTICKWVKPVFWLGCCRCIFHGTGNSAQLCETFCISGGTPSIRHWLQHKLVSLLKVWSILNCVFNFNFNGDAFRLDCLKCRASREVWVWDPRSRWYLWSILLDKNCHLHVIYKSNCSSQLTWSHLMSGNI